jgi:hypothetical protein
LCLWAGGGLSLRLESVGAKLRDVRQTDLQAARATSGTSETSLSGAPEGIRSLEAAASSGADKFIWGGLMRIRLELLLYDFADSILLYLIFWRASPGVEKKFCAGVKDESRKVA